MCVYACVHMYVYVSIYVYCVYVCVHVCEGGRVRRVIPGAPAAFRVNTFVRQKLRLLMLFLFCYLMRLAMGVSR